jgi:hypothetical protein
MLPAFENWRATARFGALLLALLLLPVFLNAIGLPPRIEVYNGLRVRGGPYVKTRQQLFATTGDIDIAFVGSSVLNVAVNVDELQARLEERYGGDVNVRMFGFVFQGFDMQYVMLRDLLEHRKVKLVVMSLSGESLMSDMPHVQLHNLLRYGEYPEMYHGLSFVDRAAMYGSHALDGPRQLIKLLRAEQPIDAADNRRSFMVHETRGAGVAPPAPVIVLSDETRHEFMFGDPGLSSRQRHFATKLAELADQHDVPIVILHVPTPEDFEYERIWERAEWPRILAGSPALVGFRRTDLFGDGPASQFYSDRVHLNAEGQDRFTRSLTPYLMARYAELTNR